MKKFISLLFAACMSVCAFADLQGTSTEASQFSFTDGYNYHLSTSAAGVVCEFELLDDKVGVVAYVWDYTNGFKEHMMTNVEGKQFTYTLKGYAAGTFVHVACKFAFAGGMAVTQDFFYEVETVQGEDGEPIVEPTGWDAIDWVPGSCFEVPQVEIPDPQPETALENVEAASTMKQLVDGHLLYISRGRMVRCTRSCCKIKVRKKPSNECEE